MQAARAQLGASITTSTSIGAQEHCPGAAERKEARAWSTGEHTEDQ